MLRQIRLLVFDLDYLVFDCSILKTKTLRHSLIPLAEQIPQDIRLPDGVDIENAFLESGSKWIRMLEIGLDQHQLEALETDYRSQERRFVEAGVGQVFPGIRELVAGCRLEGLMVALGADSSRDYLMAVCDRHDLDQFFEIALCTEEFGRGSADEMITEIMSHAEVNPSETLLLGTRPFYFEAGHNLDILGIGCGWGVHDNQGLSAADFQSASIEHLLPLIRQADALSSNYSG